MPNKKVWGVKVHYLLDLDPRVFARLLDVAAERGVVGEGDVALKANEKVARLLQRFGTAAVDEAKAYITKEDRRNARARP